MIKHTLLIKLLEQRLREREAYLGPLPPEMASERRQSALDAYKEAVGEEIEFLRAVLEKTT